jgi:hypothetical protein
LHSRAGIAQVKLVVVKWPNDVYCFDRGRLIPAAAAGFLSIGRRTGFFPYRDEKFFALGSKPVSSGTKASVVGCDQELGGMAQVILVVVEPYAR